MTTWHELKLKGQSRLGKGDEIRNITLFIRHLQNTQIIDWHAPVEAADIEAFDHFLKDRVKGRPMSHFLGHRAFWKEEFVVNRHVLDPRPDSELLVETALNLAPHAEILELGLGSGAVLLSILKDLPEARGTGVDISAEALSVAGQNAQKLGVSDRVTMIEGDWCAPLEKKYDLIICNPPYLSKDEYANSAPELHWDPKVALTDQFDGLNAYRTIAQDIAPFITLDGHLLLEIGATQTKDVSAIFKANGFASPEILLDINGKERVLRFLSPEIR